MLIVVLLRSPKRLKSMYRRLVFGMSCMDILHSLCWVAAGLPAPKDEAADYTIHAIGNRATCNIQGLGFDIGIFGSLLYTTMLSIYFVMVVVYSKPEDAKRIEPFFHVISIFIPLGFGILTLMTKNYNDSGTGCWIVSYPLNCTDPHNDVECIRGEHAYEHAWVLHGIANTFCILIVIACMVRLVWFMRKRLEKMNKYGANEFGTKVNKTESKKQRNGLRKSKNEQQKMFTQAMLYIGSLILSYMFCYAYEMKRNNFWLYLLEVTLLPLQGIMNFLIFIRPRVVMIMEFEPDLSYFQAFYTAITVKEVISLPGRRGNVEMSMMNSSAQTPTGRRSSLMSDDDMQAAAAHIVQEEDACELEDGLEGLEGMKCDSPPNSTCELEQLTNDLLNSPAAHIVQEEDACELEDGLEGLKGMKCDYPPNSTCGLEELTNDLLPKSPEAQKRLYPSNTNHDADGAFNMTENYTNML